MSDLTEQLISLSDRLDKEGKPSCANAVDSIIKSASLEKIAQYVGVIGYVLKQHRAMGNCIRKKRANSEAPMQTVVFECLKEYQDGQQYSNTEWTAKYAQLAQESADINCTLKTLLESAREHNDIGDHLSAMSKTAETLSKHSEDKTVIHSVLSDVNTIKNILEGMDTNPFKVAAPQSPRNWWSRFWSPSWTSRGEDKDTEHEMDQLLEDIRGISLITQRMKLNIEKMQNRIGSYLENLPNNIENPIAEREDYITNILNKIKDLDENSWSKTILTIQQLIWILNNTVVRNPRHQKFVDLGKNTAQDMKKDAESVYEYITDIQNVMFNLRQRKPIIGRDIGGEDNRGFRSPSYEFAQLEKVLQVLYRDPFNEQALYYADRLHGVLDDKLRYIENEDKDVSEYLNSIDSGTPDSKTTNTTNIMSNEAIHDVANSLANDNMPAIIQVLDKLYIELNQQEKDSTISNALSVIQTIRDILIDKQGNVMNAPENAGIGSGANNSIENQQNTINESSDVDEFDDFTQQYSNQAGMSPIDYLKQNKQSTNMHTIIKIADEIDKQFPDVAEVIDEYLERNKLKKEKITIMPEFGHLIKEDIYQLNAQK